MKLPLKMTLHFAENIGLSGAVEVRGEKPRRSFLFRYVATSDEDRLTASILLFRDKDRVFMVELGGEHIRTLLSACQETFTVHRGFESMDLWLKEWPEQVTEPGDPIHCLGNLFGATRAKEPTP